MCVFFLFLFFLSFCFKEIKKSLLPLAFKTEVELVLHHDIVLTSRLVLGHVDMRA